MRSTTSTSGQSAPSCARASGEFRALAGDALAAEAANDRWSAAARAAVKQRHGLLLKRRSDRHRDLRGPEHIVASGISGSRDRRQGDMLAGFIGAFSPGNAPAEAAALGAHALGEPPSKRRQWTAAASPSRCPGGPSGRVAGLEGRGARQTSSSMNLRLQRCCKNERPMNLGPGKELIASAASSDRIAKIMGDGSELGDDCAVIPLGSTTLAISMDNCSRTSIPHRLARLQGNRFRAAGSALSDLAAEGARAAGVLVSLASHRTVRRKATLLLRSWRALPRWCTTSKRKCWAGFDPLRAIHGRCVCDVKPCGRCAARVRAKAMDSG